MLEPDQISHTQGTCMVAKRGLTYNMGRRSYPYVKKSFNTQHVRIQIDPAILAVIGHRFTGKKNFFFKCDSKT